MWLRTSLVKFRDGWRSFAFCNAQRIQHLFQRSVGSTATANLCSNPLCEHSPPTLFSPLHSFLHNSPFSTSLFSNTSLQHFSTTLFSNTSLQHISTTLFSNTSLPHCSPTLLYNTSLQLSSPTLLYNTLGQRPTGGDNGSSVQGTVGPNGHSKQQHWVASSRPQRRVCPCNCCGW